MPIDDKAIGDKLRQIRIARSLSQGDVAKSLHRDRAVISRIECGKQSIGVTDLAQFSEVYDVEVITFFERSLRPSGVSRPEEKPKRSDNPLSYF